MSDQKPITESGFAETVAIAKLPSEFGTFKIYGYRNTLDNSENVAIIKGEVEKFDNPVMVRIHSECLTGDALGSLRCDCGMQLQIALRMIEKAGQGVIIYLAQEGRGIGLLNKVKAYSLQDLGLDTVEANERLGFSADLRDYSIVAQILKDLGVKQIRLITNNPRKIAGLESYGIEIADRIPLVIEPNDYNLNYLTTKAKKLGHLIKLKHRQPLAVNTLIVDEHLEDIWSALLECKEVMKNESPQRNEYWAFFGNAKSPWSFQKFSSGKIPFFPESDFLIIIDLTNDFCQDLNFVSKVFSQVQYAIVFKNSSPFKSDLVQDTQCFKGMWSSNGWQIFSLYLGLLVAQRAAYLEKRPFLMAHLAQSLDGRIAATNGNSQWLSNEANLKHAHRLRALHDAVMVGAVTATLDNPKLTVRLVTGKHPIPVIIEGQSDLKLDDLQMMALHERMIVLYPQEKQHRVIPQAAKEKILELPISSTKDSHENSVLAPSEILNVLYENGISSIFLEGGGQTVSYFLQADCIELLHLHVSPLILGSGRSSFTLPVIDSIDKGLRFKMKHFDFDGEILMELLLLNKQSGI
ncbi:MAG: GTP cyclohydrolase II [Iphinoe sp. HA4291-MV1]|jgi:GTP cyclohydrolase II|nr:GTP cyclohydrolase II [Iphinoe sp. HA4291-MV1]